MTKEEFLKFLNCSHHSIQPETIWASGPKNSQHKVVKRLGKYTASKVLLEECSLNNQVLRVPLPKVDITGRFCLRIITKS